MSKEPARYVVLTDLRAPLCRGLDHPHVVVVVVGGASGRAVVRVYPLWSLLIDEGVGPRWTHKHIFKGFCAFL